MGLVVSTTGYVRANVACLLVAAAVMVDVDADAPLLLHGITGLVCMYVPPAALSQINKRINRKLRRVRYARPLLRFFLFVLLYSTALSLVGGGGGDGGSAGVRGTGPLSEENKQLDDGSRILGRGRGVQVGSGPSNH